MLSREILQAEHASTEAAAKLFPVPNQRSLTVEVR